MPDTLSLQFDAPDYSSAQQIGVIALTKIQEQLSGSRSGKYYPIPGNKYYDRLTPQKERAKNYWVKFAGASSRREIQGAAYRASAPGESPAVRTGRLRQSFYMIITPSGLGTYQVEIKTNILYADDLEYGTERVEPRPFIEPAIQRAIPEIIKIQMNFVYKVMRG